MKLVNVITNTFKGGELSNEDYHLHSGISGTGLSKIYSTSVLSWLGTKRKPSDALGFGIASHASFMEPDLFEGEFYCGFDESKYPNSMRTQNHFKDYLSKHGLKLSGSKSEQIERILDNAKHINQNVQIIDVLKKEWDSRNKNKIEVSAKDFKNLKGMRARLMEDPYIINLISGAKIECSIIAKVDFYEEFNNGENNNGQYITCVKIRPDIVSRQFVLTDYKTCLDCFGKFQRDIFNLNYDLKMALQHDVLTMVYGQSPEVNLLAQNKMAPSEEENPFEYKTWILDQRCLDNGRKKYLIAIKRWIDFKATGELKGQDNTPEIVDLPKYFEV